MRRFVMALAIAGIMAGGFGTAGLEARKRGGGGTSDPKVAICTYLKAVMDYEYTSPYVYVYAASLYTYYDCGTVLAAQ